MTRVENKPGSYVKRSDLAKVGASKTPARVAKPLNDADRNRIAERLSEGMARGEFVSIRRPDGK
ncbi:hypothetical protein ACU8V1_13945 [Rhizobium leguminosarum]